MARMQVYSQEELSSLPPGSRLLFAHPPPSAVVVKAPVGAAAGGGHHSSSSASACSSSGGGSSGGGGGARGTTHRGGPLVDFAGWCASARCENICLIFLPIYVRLPVQDRAHIFTTQCRRRRSTGDK